MIIMPDIHKLNPYDLNFINKMRNISEELNFSYLDLLGSFKNMMKQNCGTNIKISSK